jgi:hypothetical protein
MFKPSDIVRALGPRVPIGLAVVALGIAAFDLWLVRPTYVEFSNHGRHVIGEVVLAVPAEPSRKKLGTRRSASYSTVGGHDTELGWQTVEISDVRRLGERVPILCLTSARRCEPAEKVASYVARWPATAGMLSAAGALALAVLLATVLALDRWKVRRRSAASHVRR